MLRPELAPFPERLYYRFTINALPMAGVLDRLEERLRDNTIAFADYAKAKDRFWELSASKKWLDYATREQAFHYPRCIEHFEKAGYVFLGGELQLSRAMSHIDVRGIPSKPNIPKRKPGEPSIPIERIDTTDWNYYTQNVAGTDRTEHWDYELSGMFARKKPILTEFLEEKPDHAG